MRILTEYDYRVLGKILNPEKDKGLSKTSGVTRNELKERTNLSYTKVGDALKILMEYEFVAMGMAKGREKTYYLTPNGLTELKEITQKIINVKKEKISNE
jgi:DNA-binding transcriptional regulator GbsR (MarR family)